MQKQCTAQVVSIVESDVHIQHEGTYTCLNAHMEGLSKFPAGSWQTLVGWTGWQLFLLQVRVVGIYRHFSWFTAVIVCWNDPSEEKKGVLPGVSKLNQGFVPGIPPDHLHLSWHVVCLGLCWNGPTSHSAMSARRRRVMTQGVFRETPRTPEETHSQ